MQVLTRVYQALKTTTRFFLLISILVILSSGFLQGQSTPSQEMQIKGVFLYNFANFTQWPEEKFSNPSAPFVIGILGDDPFGPFIDEIVKDEQIAGHPIVVHRYRSLEDLGSCHVLFVERNQSARLDEIFNRVKGKSILTVSDINEFTPKGGIVRFYLEDNKMRFEVNMSAAQEADLVLSSRLLRLANICCD